MLYDINKTFSENINNHLFETLTPPKNFTLAKRKTINFLGLKLNSPIGIAACPIMHGHGIAAMAKLGFDFFTYKTIRAKESPCHPLPNICYIQKTNQTFITTIQPPSDPTKIAITNSFGNASFDPAFHLQDISFAKSQLSEGQLLNVSIYGETEKEFCDAATIALNGGADCIEANLSCPNLKSEKARYLDIEPSLAIEKNQKQHIDDTPLIIKLGLIESNQHRRELLTALSKAGANAICLINSLPIHAVNEKHEPAFSKDRMQSGLSGDLIRSIALQQLRLAKTTIKKNRLDLSIIATGGVTHNNHFDLFLENGATIALSATGVMWQPFMLYEPTHKERTYEYTS